VWTPSRPPSPAEARFAPVGDEDDSAQRPAEGPVAAVVVETPLAHLDRVFEYAVPDELSSGAVPGARVKVRFAGRDLDGFVVARRERPEHDGRLTPLRRVVSPEPVLTPEVLALCRAVASRYAGTLSDVLRLAVPRRHATAERNLPPAPEAPPPLAALDAGAWAAYPAGPAWLRRVAAGESPSAAWTALPGRRGDGDWPAALAVAAATALASGRGSILVVPDHRDVDRLDAALTGLLGKGRHVRLTADQGPQARYTAWLKVLRGHVQVVIGTRAAAFAPVHDLGLVAWWDDGDDLLAEPRAPYHHTGVVLGLRATATGAALLTGGFGRSLRVQVGVKDGALVPVEAEPATVRASVPRVTIAGEGLDEERDGPAARAHLPSRAWRVAKDALVDGPVLVQVPRRGYQPSLSCAECRTPVRCTRCRGPVSVPGAGRAPSCRWCGLTMADAFECASCGSHRLRSAVTGARRTAEEIGRAFPGIPVHTSGSGEVLATVGAEPALVIATPGAEPVARGGYSAVLLLDAWASLDLPVLDAPVEAVRRWLAGAALAAPGRAAVLCGAPEAVALPAVEALVRWDPAWLASRELAERAELGLPPALRVVQLTGSRRGLESALRQLDDLHLPPSAQVLGPVPLGSSVQRMSSAPSAGESGGARTAADHHVLIRVPPEQTLALTTALVALKAVRSARKEVELVTVRVDPLEMF
jgi:primosomal protein N' (replication factor Y)